MEDTQKPVSLAPKGYSPNDFFWVSAREEMKTVNCNTVLDNQSSITCTDPSIGESDIKTCYQAELCKNKNYSKWLGEIQQTHSGADMRNADTQNVYNIEIRNTINLGMGIIVLGLFTYFNQK